MRICLIQPAIGVQSETFIRAHAERLPGVGGVIYRSNGLVSADGQPVLSQNFAPRVGRWLWRRCLRQSWQWETDRGYATALRRFRADVALVEYATTAKSARSGCELAGVPLVVHFHGYDASRLDLLESLAADYRAIFQQAGAVIVVSRAMQRRILELGCPEQKLIYNPYGVDPEHFQGANPATSDTRFVAVGRLVEKKAPYLTLLAFAKVIDQLPEARLRVVGDGPLLGVCRDLVEGMGIGHAVSFLGLQPHEVVQQEMRAARAFVQHSVTASNGDSEGTPVAVLEAGAMGLPVVATRHAGIPDVVLEHQTGLLVEERDVSAMAQHMTRLGSDPGLAGRLGQNAAMHVRNHYTMDQSISRLHRVLTAVAAGQDLDPVRQSIEDELVAVSQDVAVSSNC